MEYRGSQYLAPELNAETSMEPKFIRPAGLLFALVLLLSLPQAAFLPLLDRDEPRFAEASREMLQNGNLVVPTFDHAPRYAKPPLIYWAQATTFMIFGENAFAARLPSLLATAGTAVLLFVWGVALGSESVGRVAALCYAFCLQVVQQGRVATADALLVFFVTLTVFAGGKLLLLARSTSARGWKAWGLLFTLALAGGFLTKGPEALLPVMPLFWLLRKNGARVFLALLAMLALALLLVSAWAIPAYIETGGAYWREGLGHDVGDRMVTGFQGHGAGSLGWYMLALPFYFLLFWLSALPWSPLLLVRRKQLFAAWRPDETDLYLLLQAALFFVVFSFMVTKLPHYTLPAFPLLALLFARRWFASGLSPGLPSGFSWATGISLALLALALIPLFFVMPQATPSPAGRLVREAGDLLRPETQFALVDYQEPNTIWEMRRVVSGYSQVIGARQVPAFLDQPGGRAVLLTQEAYQKIAALVTQNPKFKVFFASGWNAAKLARVDLVLVLKQRQ